MGGCVTVKVSSEWKSKSESAILSRYIDQDIDDLRTAATRLFCDISDELHDLHDTEPYCDKCKDDTVLFPYVVVDIDHC